MTGPDTTPRPLGEHLDLDTLADQQEGLLDPAREAAVAEHLATCHRCAAERDELARLPGMLAAAGEVGPTPVEVVTQLDAALAAEQLGVAATAGTTVTPLRSSPPRTPLGTRILQAAAVVVLLLAGLGIAISAIGTGGGSDAGSTAAKSAADAAGGSDPFPLTSSGLDWSSDRVASDAPELLTGELSPPVRATTLQGGSAAAREGGTDTDETAPQAFAGDAARLAGGPALADCVAALADGPVTPLAVDVATWQRKPAAVILLPAPGDATSFDVWVVAPGCSTADEKLLYYANLPRP